MNVGGGDKVMISLTRTKANAVVTMKTDGSETYARQMYEGHGHVPVAFILLLRKVVKSKRDKCSSHTAMLVLTVTVERHKSESALGLSVKHQG